MSLALAFALFFAAPPPDALPPHAARAVESWLTTARAEGRTLEPLAEHVTDTFASATFLDRTGGCARGWVRLRVTPAAGAAPGRPDLEEHLGAPCDAPPAPLNHLMRLLEATRLGDRRTLGTFVPPGAQLPIASELGPKLTRQTFDHERVVAGQVPLPACAPETDTPSCDPAMPDPVTGTARLTCRCVGPTRTVTFALRALAPEVAPDEVQLVSIRVHR